MLLGDLIDSSAVSAGLRELSSPSTNVRAVLSSSPWSLPRGVASVMASSTALPISSVMRLRACGAAQLLHHVHTWLTPQLVYTTSPRA